MKGCSPEPWLPGTSSPVAQAPEGQAVLRPGVTAYAGGGRQGQPGGTHSLYARDLQAPLVQEAHRLPGKRGLRPSQATLCLTIQLLT